MIDVIISKDGKVVQIKGIASRRGFLTGLKQASNPLTEGTGNKNTLESQVIDKRPQVREEGIDSVSLNSSHGRDLLNFIRIGNDRQG